MSRDASIGPLDWAGASRTFRLGNAELILLQEATDCGPLALMERLSGKHWLVQDISHSIRLGLIGGGMKPDEAHQLVRSYVETRPPLENVMLAFVIVSAGVKGAPDEKPGEAEGEAKAKGSTTSPTGNSAGA